MIHQKLHCELNAGEIWKGIVCLVKHQRETVNVNVLATNSFMADEDLHGRKLLLSTPSYPMVWKLLNIIPTYEIFTVASEGVIQYRLML